MTTATSLICLCCCHTTILVRTLQDLVHNIWTFQRQDDNICDASLALGRIMSNLMFLLVEVLSLTKEVVKVLIVHFNERSFHLVCPTFSFELFGALVNLRSSTRNHPIYRRHCVSLARTRLTITEDAHIVAIECGLNQLADLIEYIGIGASRTEYVVKRECMSGSRNIAQGTLLFGPHHYNFSAFTTFPCIRETDLRNIFLFIVKGWSNTAEYTNISFQLLNLVVELPPQCLFGS